jgi:DNA repair protein RadC
MESTGTRITDLPADQRPRERLQRLGPDALTDAEVVAILIGSGRPGQNAVETAQRLLRRAGGMAGLVTMTLDGVQREPGIGPAAASRIMAAAELRRRAARAKPMPGVMDTAGIAAAVLPHLADRQRERLVVVVLDRRLHLLEVVDLPEGTPDHAAVPTAEILRTVISRGGTAFALAHNHPGGSLQTSPADRTATGQVRAAADACGLRFLDHLIVAGDDWGAIE